MKWLKQWTIESRSEPGVFYTVSMGQDRRLACSCKNWIFTKKVNGVKAECKHGEYVRGQLEAARAEVAMATVSGNDFLAARVLKLERGLKAALDRVNDYADTINRTARSNNLPTTWRVESWLDRLENVKEPVVPERVPERPKPEEFVIKRMISFDE